MAVLLVVLYHAGAPVLSRGYVGVDVFFVISGFVITTTLVRELELSGTIRLGRFYLRRVKRLLPALAVMLTTVALAAILLAPAGTGREAGLTGVTASLFSANIYLDSLPTGYFAANPQLNPFLHTWTLGVEEQFYLVFPLILLAAWLRGLNGRGIGSPRGTALWAIALVAVISFGVATIWWHGWQVGWLSNDAVLAFYGLPARAWEFGLGALITLAAPKIRRLPSTLIAGMGLVGVVALCLATVGLVSVGGSAAAIAFAALAATAFIIAGFARNRTSRILASRGMVFVGDRSYSLYLWHWPFIVFAHALAPGSSLAAPLAATVSVGPALASYRYVENPTRFNPTLRGRTLFALTVACVSITLATSAGLVLVQRYLPTTQTYEAHADRVRGCTNVGPFGSASLRGCDWTIRHPRGSIVLIGDSNAGQFTEPVVAAGNQAGFDVEVATMSNCPFVQLRVHWRGNTDCDAFVRQSLPALVAARPNLVILGARADSYLSESSTTLGRLSSGRMTDAPRVKRALWIEGLRSEVSRLITAHIPVIVIDPVPLLPANTQNCAVILLVLDRCRGTLARTVVDAQLSPARTADRQALRGFRAAWPMSVENELCTAVLCSTRSPGGRVILYVDPRHLSVAGAETLTPQFYDVIRAHARSA